MNCEDIEHLLPNFLDNDLTEELTKRIRQHLLVCPRCAWERSSLETAIRILIQSHPPSEARDTWKETLLERLEGKGLDEGWLFPLPEPVSRRQLVIASLIRDIESEER